MAIADEVLAALQERLEALSAEYARRLTASYRTVLSRLAPEAEALEADIRARLERGETVTPNSLRRLRRYQALMRTAAEEMTRYGAVVEDAVNTGREAAIREAGWRVREMVAAQVPGMVRESVMATFAPMPTEAVAAMVAALDEHLPLRVRVLARYGEPAARKIADTLVYAMAAGKHPRVTAREMRNAWGVPLTDALRISRTETARAFQLATLDSYRRNGHVVKGWVWRSALIPGRTCAACVAMDGTEHSLAETLDDHPNGLCVMEPMLVSWEELGLEGVEELRERQDGPTWFAGLAPEVQERMLGPGLYELYVAGTPLSEMVAWREDADWGRTVGVRSLKSLMGDMGE